MEVLHYVGCFLLGAVALVVPTFLSYFVGRAFLKHIDGDESLPPKIVVAVLGAALECLVVGVIVLIAGLGCAILGKPFLH